MADLHIVVLAAGKGTRLKSDQPKVLHRVAGRPMIERVLETADRLRPRSTTVVVGHMGEALREALCRRAGLDFAVQEPQLGTAHALLMAEPALRSAHGVLVLLSGDVPLLSAATLERLIRHHESTRASATLLTAVVERPYGYGRIVRSAERIAKVVEEKDATEGERQIREINAGIYAFALDGLFDAVRGIAAENVQNEYYLPDLVALFRRRGLGVETVVIDDTDEILGVNSRADLAMVGRIARQRKAVALMADGVTIEDPSTTYIDPEVEIGSDTVIRPGVSLEGRTRLGKACIVYSGTRIADSTVGDRVVVLDHSIVESALLGNDVQVGPFARLRAGATLADRAHVGNFVEVKKTSIGEGSKAMHLAYLGDAVIGANVNVGAGTITCNYDGRQKQVTTIEDGAFIGSDTQLIAPVTVGKGAYVGTGTTIREDVPAGALAVSAGKQRNIEGWAEKKRLKPKG
jgi:bifunctional UDP-N-acetylglucosamine pyrophosphorylase/glucosamine-1-phosphate N-acetyltransferase